jgi:hypothetical protein
VTIVVALGPLPRAKIANVYKDLSLSAYSKCHMVMELLKSTYCWNTPGASGRLKQEMAELQEPKTFKGAMNMVSKLILLNVQLMEMTGISMSDINMRDLVYRKSYKDRFVPWSLSFVP